MTRLFLHLKLFFFSQYGHLYFLNLYVHVDKISNHVKKKKDVKTLTVAFSFDYLASV